MPATFHIADEIDWDAGPGNGIPGDADMLLEIETYWFFIGDHLVECLHEELVHIPSGPYFEDDDPSDSSSSADEDDDEETLH